jgi:pilus assembly protein Flp/PilA
MSQFVAKTAQRTKQLVVREEGATMVEYGLMVALIAVVCLAAVTLLGTNVSSSFNNIATKLSAPAV